MKIFQIMRKYREQKVRENAHIYVKKNPSGSVLDSEFTLYELKRALEMNMPTELVRQVYLYSTFHTQW